MDNGKATELIVIDMLNRYEHEDGGRPLKSVREIVPALAWLIKTAGAHNIPIVCRSVGLCRIIGIDHLESQPRDNGERPARATIATPTRNPGA